MSLDRTQTIKLYATRLVNSLVPSSFGDEFTQSFVNDLLSNAMGNHVYKSEQQRQYELDQLTAHYKSYFLAHGMDWFAFERIWDQLVKVKSLDQLHSYLMFFNALQNSPISERRGSTPDSFKDFSPRYASRLSNRPPSNMGNSSSPSHDDKTATLDQIIRPYYESLSEEVILTYLPYTLLGLDSKLVTFQSDTQLELPPDINNSYTSLLTRILEAGLLYRNCQAVVDKYKGRLGSSVKTAFVVVLEAQLNMYVNHVNQMFARSPPSVISIYSSIFRWTLKLRLLYSLCTKAEALSGFSLLSHVYELTKFEDPHIRDLASMIFNDMATPYYEKIEHWIINGELSDTDSDTDKFFIQFHIDEPQFNDIIEYVPEQRPFFCNEETSYKMYQIGKMVIFLTKVCKELDWINKYVNKYSTIVFRKHSGLKSMSPSELQELVEMQYTELLNYFTLVVHGHKNEFFSHVSNFKRFYLTQNNEFIELIISKGAKILNEPSSNISSNYLSKLLGDSISESALRHNAYSKRLDARILDPIHGNIGWEVFTIEYRIDDLPIHAILESSIMQYLKIFNFLWRIRHLHYLLVQNTVESASLKKLELVKVFRKYNKVRKSRTPSVRDRHVMWLKKTFNIVGMIRSNLIKFLNGMLGYLMFDVIEDSFERLVENKLFSRSVPTGQESDDIGSGNPSRKLLDSLNPNFTKHLQKNTMGESLTATHNMNELTFDELEKIHADYLNGIINSKLINEASVGKHTKRTIISQIYEILEVIFHFIKGSEEYNNLLINYILVLNIDDNDSGEGPENDLQEIEARLQVLMKKLYKNIYISQYKVLLGDLVRDLKSDLDLRDLSYTFAF